MSSILGIGGGVCMDLAKTIAFGVKQTTDIWDILSYAKVRIQWNTCLLAQS
ncbi:MAG: iron-containing alcohol dehydrogenase [[Clostridium] nexile]